MSREPDQIFDELEPESDAVQTSLDKGLNSDRPEPAPTSAPTATPRSSRLAGLSGSYKEMSVYDGLLLASAALIAVAATLMFLELMSFGVKPWGHWNTEDAAVASVNPLP